MMDAQQVKNIIEACLLVAGRAMSLRQLDELFEGDESRPDKETIKSCVEQLQVDYEGRGIELVQVASGYRLQSRSEVSEWVARLFPEKPPRYSRALLETLVLVAYRQPITRGEIEEIRGVAVSSNIVKTLQERQWVKEVGFKDVPGKPALLGTTKNFLDYFNLKRLDDLPPLSEIKNLDEMDAALMEAAGIAPAQDSAAANDGEMPDGGVGANVDADINLQDSVETSADEQNGTVTNLDLTVETETEAGAEASAEASAEQSTDANVEVSSDTEGREETTEAAEVSADLELAEGDLEQTSFVAGAANNVNISLGSESAEELVDDAIAEEAAGQTVVATDGSDDPVTFAGLVSDLPPLEQVAVDNKAAAVSGDTFQETPQKLESDQMSMQSNTDATQSEEAGSEAIGDLSKVSSDEEQKLYSKLSEYAEERQKDVEARDVLDNQLQTRYKGVEESDTAHNESSNDGGVSTEAELVTADADEHENSSTADTLGDAIEASSSSIDVLSDTFTGDTPGAGETLH